MKLITMYQTTLIKSHLMLVYHIDLLKLPIYALH
jgi:hypothetical protein